MMINRLREAKWLKWTSRISDFLKKQKVTTKLLFITSLITLFNVVAGGWIFMQNASVRSAVKASNELQEAKKEYQGISDSMLRTLLSMIDAVENGSTGDDGINLALKSMPERVEKLKVTLAYLDEKYPHGDNGTAYSNQGNVFGLALEQLNKENGNHSLLTIEDRSAKVKQLVSTYTIVLSFANETVENWLEVDTVATQETLNKSIAAANTIIIINIVLLAVLPFLMSYSLSRNVKKGIVGLMKRITAYQNNDFTYDEKLDRQDEFGQIDRSLAQMGSELRDTLRSTMDVSTVVLQASRNMGDMIVRNQNASEQVKEEIGNGKTILMTQYDDATSISAVTEQISASSQQIAASTEYINRDMKEMRESSRIGSTDMKGVVQMVNQTVQQFARVTESFDQINERYNNVTKFLGGIQDLNTQTNLLSLNASIESARAGEHGRGFAVVAEEIRKLSSQTDIISKDITKELKLIQNDFADSSQSLSSFSEVIETTKQASVTASEMFNGLENQSSVLSEQMGEISVGIDEITKGITDIVGSVDKLLQTSSEVNGKMEQMSGMSEDQFEVSIQLQELAEKLQGSSTNLREKAAVFKV
ncbi:hypothetical protein ASF12_20945 [Paenibacillus sp. Leaf72]|nr:hypothetical protein ASF12_20945 [Paenibacillus sp. Leaf72]